MVMSDDELLTVFTPHEQHHADLARHMTNYLTATGHTTSREGNGLRTPLLIEPLVMFKAACYARSACRLPVFPDLAHYMRYQELRSTAEGARKA